jgi:hypothetical protein
LIADSLPHGMIDEPCERKVDYQTAFTALKVLCDGFYLVGCNQQTYSRQRELIDPENKEKEQFIPLGDMADLLPELLVALAKKTESEKALREYLTRLGLENSDRAGKVTGLLRAGAVREK